MISSNSPFREKISSDVSILNQLNEMYPWIPNEVQVRPKKNVLKMKQEKLSIVKYQWRSLKDYIDHVVWGIEKVFDTSTNTFCVISAPTENYIFQLCEFPYDTNDSTHYVLWFSDVSMLETFPSSEYDDMINQILNELLTKKLNGDRYSFAWYINPKMSVPDYFHVQVFVKENRL